MTHTIPEVLFNRIHALHKNQAHIALTAIAMGMDLKRAISVGEKFDPREDTTQCQDQKEM